MENKLEPEAKYFIFATHVFTRMLDKMKKETFLKSLSQHVLLVMMSLCLSIPLMAQYDDDYDDQGQDDYYYDDQGDDYSDSSDGYEDDGYDDYGDDGYDDYDDYDDGGDQPANGIALENGGKVGKPIKKKEYVRFSPPMDTITKLITYVEVVEVKDHEGFDAYSDSLYTRAQRWLGRTYNKKELKDYLKQSGIYENGEGYIIEVAGEFPLIIKPNEFTTREDGKVQFEMELRFKDGRYRYKINNLVHVQPPMYGGKDEIRTYMEYYTKTKRDIESSDVILMAADEHIKKMIKGIKEECKEPIFVDDEDW